MDSSRWWHVAVIATTVALSALVVLSADVPWQAAVALGALAAFLVVWFAIGMKADRTLARSIAFAAVIVVVAGIGTAAVPSFASFQSIAYPLLWTRARSTRSALIANVALAIAVGVGFFFSTGADMAALVQAGAIQGFSLAFSVAFGFWITQIQDRSIERQRLLDKLHATQDQLAAVSRDAGVMSERERLAREIHDTIAQDLTGLVLLTQRARRELADGDVVAVDEQLGMLEDSARTALAETRSLVAATAPVGLATGGIGDALERLGARFERETGLDVTVSATGLPALDRDTEVVLLRCSQEALANVRKHASAGAASIVVTAEDGLVTLTVTDNGSGFDPAAGTEGFGLAGMRERLALVGGALCVDSGSSGTTLTITLGGPR